MRRGVLLVALLLAGCATPKLTAPLPAPAPEKLLSPAPTPQPTQTPGPTTPAKGSNFSDLRAQLVKADELLVAGQDREAVALLLQSVKGQPSNPAAWDLLTFGLIRLGEPMAARITAARAVELQPGGSTVQFNAGMANYRARQWGEAVDHFTTAANLNQASNDPKLFLARAKAQQALYFGDEPALREAAARFPNDPEMRLNLVQLTLTDWDLDLDRKPEVITKTRDRLTVTNGVNGAVYLSVPIPPQATTQDEGFFNLLGDEGERFFSVNLTADRWLLYRFDGKTLVEVGSGAGDGRFDLFTRELETEYTDAEKHLIISQRYTWRAGALRLVSSKSIPDKIPEARVDLKDAVDLFVAGTSLDRGVFATEALYDEVMTRAPSMPTSARAFILPGPDGSFHMDLWLWTEHLGTARVRLNKAWQIEQLFWE